MQQLNMIALEPLEPAQSIQQQQQQTNQAPPQQAILGAIDPAAQQTMHQQQQQQPLLHQLQPSNHHQLLEQQQQQHKLETQQQQLQQDARDEAAGSTGRPGQAAGYPRQRSGHIEGIAADGGGPIVQWLHENYEIADGESLPRSTVYNHYLAHCRHLGLSSVNAASFGKLIRSVFLGLKTRRLGTRGHSKYHYFGVRAKRHIRLDWLHEVNDGGDGRAGCSSAGMLRDSNDTNSNGSNGNCGSETDSTGNCSGRLSTSISGHNNNNPNTTTIAATNNTSSTNANKRQKRDPSTALTVQDDYQGGPLEPTGDNLEDLDHPHHHPHHHHHASHRQHHNGGQSHYPHQQQLNHHLQLNQDQHQNHLAEQQQQLYGHDVDHPPPPATNGMYLSAYPMNGYDKQAPFVCTQDERAPSGPQWSTPLDQYDLSSFRNHLGPNKSTLVYDNWPEREPGLLERQLEEASGTDKQQGQSNNADKSTGVGDSAEPPPPQAAAPASGPIDRAELARLVEPFENQYKFYYKRMVELLGELQFNEIEPLWSEFWHPPAARPPTSSITEPVRWPSGGGTGDDNMAQQQQQQPDQSLPTYQNDPQQQQQQQHMIQLTNLLTFEQLYQLTSQPVMIERINQIDYKLYSAIESFLVVDMLSPLPRPLIHHLRNFARNICTWIEMSTKDYNPSFVSEKIRSARAFEHALRRYTSINHLSTASRAIWNKRSVLVQMSIDLSRLDLRDIEHQVASLMSQEKFVGMDSAVDNCRCCRSDSTRNTESQQHGLLQSNEVQQQQPLDTSVADQTNNGDSSSRTMMKQQGQPHQSPAEGPTPEQTVAPDSGSQSTNDNIENNYTSHHNHSSNNNNYHHHHNHQHHHHDHHHHLHSNNNDNGCLQSDNFTVAQHINEFSPMQPAQLVQNFLHLLEDPYPANAWPDWCRTLVESRVCGQSLREAQNFILKWNFYISLILRELTLRSAPSLGSIQLIRLLFDEYMYYLVVSKLAQAQNKTSTQLLRPPSAKFANI